MHIFQCVIFVCVLDAECFCKSVTKVMAGTGLKCFSIVHQRFNCVSCYCTCKFFFVCFLTFDYRNCQNFFAEISIQIQHLDRSFFCFFCCCVSSMSLLPQEFSGTKERTGCLFPTYYRTPLIIDLWQISVGLDVFLIKIAEQSLRSRTNAETLLQFIQSTMCYPRYFRCKSFYVIFFFLQKRFRNKHRHVHILHTCFFESAVQFMLDIFPNRITCRFDCHASFYTCVAAQFRFFDNVCIPLCKIVFHGSDRFN